MIVVVGDVMNDVIVRAHGPPAPHTDRAATIMRRPGGSGANIACWLGDAGVATRFAGRVGRADHATHLAAVARHGVAARLGADVFETGTVIALLDDAGGRGFLTDRGANRLLCEADLPLSLLDGARALHVSGHVFFEPGPRAAAQSLMQAARASGLAVSVDAGSAGWLAGAPPGAFRTWTDAAQVCFANAEEAALLGDAYRTLVVTFGADGAEVREGGSSLRVAATPAMVRDGTGAGDAFAAGFLAGSLAGASLRDCLRSGCDRAARAIAVPGGRPEAA